MKTREELVATKLYDLLADSRLDVELTGRHIAQTLSADIYERFVSMTDSANMEKQKRIDWIRKIIIGETEMVTSFEDKAQILSDFEEGYGEDTRYAEFIAMRNLGFPLAIAYVSEMITGITDSGAVWIEQAFDDLLELLGVEDKGWTDLYDIEKEAGLES